jgi:uncharacterized membrane protein YfcA
MSTEQVVMLLAIGIVAGFMSSMVGIGGGLVIVPALVLLYGMDQKMAQGTSLLMLALPVTAIGAFSYYKAGNVNWQAALLIGTTFILGGFLGGTLANKLETITIKRIFALFMIVIAVKYLFFDKPKVTAPKGQTVLPATDASSPE